MARSSDPRHPLPAERGPKRTGPIGTLVPGDDVEVAREIQRLWWAIEQTKQRVNHVAAAPAPTPVGSDLTLLQSITLAADGIFDWGRNDGGRGVIPATFRDLVLVWRARRSGSGAGGGLVSIRLNQVTLTSYFSQMREDNNALMVDHDGVGFKSGIHVGGAPLASDGATTDWAGGMVELLGYSDPARDTTCLSRAHCIYSSGGTITPKSYWGTGAFRSPAVVDHVRFADDTFSNTGLLAGSRLDVYGRGAA